MKTIKFKTKWMLAIMCVAVMTLTLFSCVIDGDRRVFVEGTWCVYKAEVENNGSIVTVDVNGDNENKGLYKQFVFMDEDVCSVGYYDLVDYGNNDRECIYHWTKMKGYYSYTDDSVISNCENTVFNFWRDKKEGILTLCIYQDDTPIKLYLKKVSACYW